MPRNYHEPSRTDKILKKYDDLQEKLFHDKFINTSQLQHPHNILHSESSSSPIRGNDRLTVDVEDELGVDLSSYDVNAPEAILRLKWLDNSPRMSRLREHRHKRLQNKLEQFELWDIEQEQKQKQYERAREQRYNNIVERLKSQEFCVSTMKKRHESDLETTRDLEAYSNDHLYVDALDDPKLNIQGPITQYRKFEAEMDEKVKSLQNDLDTLNPRSKIEQTILPRLERTRENFSVEPQIFTRRGKKILRKPNLNIDINTHLHNKSSLNKFSKSHFLTQPSLSSYSNKNSLSVNSRLNDLTDRPILKPIIQSHQDDSSSLRSLSKLKISHEQIRKSVNFNDDIDYRSSDKHRLHHADY